MAAGHRSFLDRATEVGLCHLPATDSERAHGGLADAIVAVEYDASGTLVASATAGGALVVQYADTLRLSEVGLTATSSDWSRQGLTTIP